MRLPRNAMRPVEGISRRIASASVVLPDPLSPTMPSVSPARTVKLAALTAFTWPVVRRIDGAYGDRNLICSCPPPESFED